MHIRWSRCPHCKKTLEFTTRGGGVWRSNVGAAVITPCQFCRQPISDGKREWDDMFLFERVNEIVLAAFGSLIVGPLMGAVIVGMLSSALGAKSFLWAMCGAVAFGVWGVYAGVTEIRESKDRTRARRTKDAQRIEPSPLRSRGPLLTEGLSGAAAYPSAKNQAADSGNWRTHRPPRTMERFRLPQFRLVIGHVESC